MNEAGIMVVKDSSANKCGVQCSSYEILASMVLTSEEFMEMKDELVLDVLKKLRSAARVEAELLFKEWKADPSCSAPVYSSRISAAIEKIHGIILK